MSQAAVDLRAPVTTCLVASGVHVHVVMNLTPMRRRVKTWTSVVMNSCVSMAVSICLEAIVVSVPSALYGTSTGTSALVGTQWL